MLFRSRRLADLAENYIRKGSQILVEGKLRYRSYDDREGVKRYVVEVEADVIQLLGRKPDGGNQQSSGGQNSQGGGGYNPPSQSGDDISDDLTTRDPADDLPF